MRSRAVSRPFLCCDSMAFAPPPWRIWFSSFFIFVNKSTMRRVFFSNSGDFRLAVVFRTEADTRGPREAASCQNDSNYKAQRTSDTVYEVYWLLREPRRASRLR